MAKNGDELPRLRTKALAPIDGPVRENVGLLGSPCFEIPRATARDKRMSRMDDATRRQRLRAKNRYNLVTAVLFLLKQLVPALCRQLCGCIVALLYLSSLRHGCRSFTAAAFAFFFAIFWALVCGTGQPGIRQADAEGSCSVLGRVLLVPRAAVEIDRTVVRGAHCSRELPSRISSRVFRECDWAGRYSMTELISTEYTLIEIGDYTNLNAGCVI